MSADKQLQIDCENAKAINLENLEKLLCDNKNTEFGKLHSFSKINGADEYRQRVPLTDYSTYDSYIKDMRNGAENLLTVYPVVSYCMTSGTEGNAKHIPITSEALKCYSDQSERYKNYVLHKVENGKRLFINTFRTDLDNAQENTLLFSEIYNRFLFENGYMNMEEYVGGRELLFNPTPGEDVMYAKVWASLLTEDLVLFESAFMYDILQFFSYFEKHWREVVADIKNNSISSTKEIAENIKKKILSLPCTDDRIKHIENECEKGFEHIAKRLWPKMSLVCGISNSAFFAEDSALGKYIGDISRQYLCYCSSECYIGNPIQANDFGYVILPKHAFYEFIPYDEQVQATNVKTLLPHELIPEKLYEIVLTNFSGLYRYRLGDVLRVKGFYGESPIVEFAFRKNQAFNIAGEKMGVWQLEGAVKKLRADGISIKEFCFGVSVSEMPGRYFALITMENSFTDIETISDALDKTLCEMNLDYKDLRELNYLEKPTVCIMENQEYQQLVESGRPKKRHNKPLHILPQHITEELLKKGEITNEKT